MVDMFTNYQNLSDYYIPNNIASKKVAPQSYTMLTKNEASKPYELYNAKGELEGYYWYYGNQLILDFSIDGELTMEANDIIYSNPGEYPTSSTRARLGQRAYNIADMISWQCTAYSNYEYIWTQNAEFTYPVTGEKSVFIDAAGYMKDKTAKITLYDFRMRPIHQQAISGTSNIKVCIDEKLSAKMRKGIYYCTLEVAGKNTSETLITPNDCKLIVR